MNISNLNSNYIIGEYLYSIQEIHDFYEKRRRYTEDTQFDRENTIYVRELDINLKATSNIYVLKQNHNKNEKIGKHLIFEKSDIIAKVDNFELINSIEYDHFGVYESFEGWGYFVEKYIVVALKSKSTTIQVCIDDPIRLNKEYINSLVKNFNIIYMPLNKNSNILISHNHLNFIIKLVTDSYLEFYSEIDTARDKLREEIRSKKVKKEKSKPKSLLSKIFG